MLLLRTQGLTPSTIFARKHAFIRKLVTGVMTVAKRVQITPVVVTASCWGYETCSGGRLKSAMLAMLMPHLKVGA